MTEQTDFVPKRRFQEFQNSHDWEQRNLGEITSLITKGTTPTDKSWIGPVNYIKTESIDSLSGNITIKANTSLEEHEGYLKRSQLKEKDILFSIVGTLGRVGIVESKDLPANTNQQIAIIRLKDSNTNFILNALKTNHIQSFIKSDSTIGAQPSLSLWQINDLQISIPIHKEQKKIGTFFKQLDHLITLHQRKLEKTKALKAAYLFEMFPTEGESEPKRRFAGFTGAWEQRKLSDVVIFLDEQRKPLESGLRESGPYPYYGASGIIDYVKDYLFDEELILLSEDGANIIDRNYRVCFMARGRYWVNNHAHVLKSKDDYCNGFICESLERLDYVQYNTGTAQPKLNQEVCRNINILVPKLEEQERISTFLEGLDYLITLHQRKLEKLQNIKKAYLNEMFV